MKVLEVQGRILICPTFPSSPQYVSLLHIKLKVKDKGRLVACHTGTVSGTSVALSVLIPGDGRRCVIIVTHPGRLIPWKETRYLGAGLEISRPDRDSNSDLSARGEEFCASTVAMMQVMRLKEF